MTATADQACHDLLVRLAGRLPDELLWRLRDWLAAEARTVLGAMLPRELLRHRVGLTAVESDLLAVAVGQWGASRRLLDAVLPADTVDEPACSFRPGTGRVDEAALSVLAVVRGHPGCGELRQAWRSVDTRSAGVARTGLGEEQRIVVVIGAERPWTLTGTLQRVLRAHGDRTPCAEVLPPHGELPDYHRAVIIGSAALWRSAALVGT